MASGPRRRLFSTITSRDFVHWTEPVLSFDVDLRDDAGSLARIEQVRPLLDRPDNPKLMRHGILRHRRLRGRELHARPSPGSSRSTTTPAGATTKARKRFSLPSPATLLHWERPFRTPVIAIGELGRWDASVPHHGGARPCRVNDEIWLYYSGANYTHGSPPVYRTAFEDGQPTGRETRLLRGHRLGHLAAGPLRVGCCR